MDKKHEPEPVIRVANIRRAHAVYKDYDGNAPDGPAFALCATEELAKEVMSILNAVDNDRDGLGTDDGELTTEVKDRIDGLAEHLRPHATAVAKAVIAWDLSLPGSEGCVPSAYWRVTTEEVEESKIATTLTEAVAQFDNIY